MDVSSDIFSIEVRISARKLSVAVSTGLTGSLDTTGAAGLANDSCNKSAVIFGGVSDTFFALVPFFKNENMRQTVFQIVTQTPHLVN